jgi:N-acetylglutamate synthase-like GNAT family acetyltransferase
LAKALGAGRSGSGLNIRRARRGDLDVITGLLEASGLPVDDVPSHVDAFLVCFEAGGLLGTVALERHGPVGLLRSLAVNPADRRRGIGRELCARIIRQAGESGTRDLYLLTTDAADYFRRLGFHDVDRRLVPEAIAETTEFKDLCPDSAILMHLELGKAKR